MCHAVNFVYTTAKAMDSPVKAMDTSSVNFIDTSVPNPCRAQITSAGLAALIRLIGSHGLRLSRGVTANSQQIMAALGRRQQQIMAALGRRQQQIMAALGRRQQQTQSIFRRAESANLTLNREALR